MIDLNKYKEFVKAVTSTESNNKVALIRQLENQITEKLGKAKGEEGKTAKDTVKIN